MTAIVCSIIISITLLLIIALLCFKGITFNKKMEVIPTRTDPTVSRPEEMDKIEALLNQVDTINAANAPVPDKGLKGYASAPTAMDAALKKIQDVFGPEQLPEEDKGDNT